MVRLYHLASRLGLKLLTHWENDINVIEDVVVKVKATEERLVYVTAYLATRTPTADYHDATCCVTSLEDDEATIYVRPPRPMTYFLIIRGRGRNQIIWNPNQEGTECQQLVVYTVRCRRAMRHVHPFPDNQGYWGLHLPMATECGLKRVKGAPFAFSADSNGEVVVPVALCRHTDMAVKLRHALDMVTELSHYTLLTYTDGGAAIRARLPRAGHYMLRVMATHPTLKARQHVADFLLLADTPCPDPHPFPRAFPFAYQTCATPLEPITRHVSRTENRQYRVHAPSLVRVHVNEKGLDRNRKGTYEGLVAPPTDLTRKQMVVSGSQGRDIFKLDKMYAYDIPDVGKFELPDHVIPKLPKVPPFKPHMQTKCLWGGFWQKLLHDWIF